MRREDERSGSLFSYVDPEARVGEHHPLRTIRTIVNEALATLAGGFFKGAVDDGARRKIYAPTQAFNTTTSMGRLTLNMLLSFAQFEREITREGIVTSSVFIGQYLPLGRNWIK